MEDQQWTITKAGRITGAFAAIAGLVGAGLLFIYWVLPYVSISFTGIHLVDPGSLGAENAPNVMFWATVVGVFSLLTWFIVRRGYLKALWVLALILLILTVLGAFSIGLYIAPFAILVVVSAVLLTIGRRGGVRA